MCHTIHCATSWFYLPCLWTLDWAGFLHDWSYGCWEYMWIFLEYINNQNFTKQIQTCITKNQQMTKQGEKFQSNRKCLQKFQKNSHVFSTSIRSIMQKFNSIQCPQAWQIKSWNCTKHGVTQIVTPLFKKSYLMILFSMLVDIGLS